MIIMPKALHNINYIPTVFGGDELGGKHAVRRHQLDGEAPAARSVCRGLNETVPDIVDVQLDDGTVRVPAHRGSVLLPDGRSGSGRAAGAGAETVVAPDVAAVGGGNAGSTRRPPDRLVVAARRQQTDGCRGAYPVQPISVSNRRAGHILMLNLTTFTKKYTKKIKPPISTLN